MSVDEGNARKRPAPPRPAYKPPAKPAYKPTYSAPAWKKPTAGMKAKPKDERDDEEPVRAAYVPPGLSPQQRPTTAAQFTPPAWWKNLTNTVAKWADENISTSQYVPAGLAQSQRPTDAKQFRKPIWGGQPEIQEQPAYSPSLPTGTFFSGGSIQDGTREVRTGENTSLLLGGGGIRNRGTVRIAKGSPMIGAPRQTAETSSGSGSSGWGTTYKKYKSGGGGGYSYPSYAQTERVPSWLMNLYNWSFKG